MSLATFFSDPFFNEDRFFQAHPSRHSHALASSGNKFLSPKCDIKEDDKSFIISAEFPGVVKENVSLDLKDGVLKLATKQNDEVEKDVTDDDGIVWHKRERHSGSYQRQFVVPKNVRSEDISATFENGVVHVVINKRTKEKEEESTRIIIQ